MTFSVARSGRRSGSLMGEPTVQSGTVFPCFLAHRTWLDCLTASCKDLQQVFEGCIGKQEEETSSACVASTFRTPNLKGSSARSYGNSS